MSTKPRPLAALAMVALISAGCSNTSADPGTGSSGGNTNATKHEKAVKFAECMRANGVRRPRSGGLSRCLQSRLHLMPLDDHLGVRNLI